MSGFSWKASTIRGVYCSIHSCGDSLKTEVNTWQLDLCVGILMFVQKNEGGVQFYVFCCIDSSPRAQHIERERKLSSDKLLPNHFTWQEIVAYWSEAQHHFRQQPPTPASYGHSYKSGCLVTASVSESRPRNWETLQWLQRWESLRICCGQIVYSEITVFVFNIIICLHAHLL